MWVVAIEVPPLVSIGHGQDRSVGSESGKHDRCGTVACDLLGLGHCAVCELRMPELGCVPRHVRVVPLHPNDLARVGIEARRRVEVGARSDDLDPFGTVASNGNQIVCRLHMGAVDVGKMGFADADVPGLVRGRASVGESDAAVDVGGGCQAPRLRGSVHSAQTLIAVVGEPDRAVGDRPSAATVFVDSSPHARVGRGHLGDLACSDPHERDPAALFGARLGEPDVVTVCRDLCEASRAGNKVACCNGRRPRAERLHRRIAAISHG